MGKLVGMSSFSQGAGAVTTAPWPEAESGTYNEVFLDMGKEFARSVGEEKFL